MTLRSRREAYRESLREEILDAARQLFVVHGYEQTSIRSIATKVGASPGILYHYFEDKADIMAHLVAETFSKLGRRLEAIRSDGDTAEARMRRGLRAYIDFGLEHPHHYALLFMQTGVEESSSKIQLAFANQGMQTFNCLRQISRECIESGALRKEIHDAEELAQTLWASIHGLVSLQVGCQGFPFLERQRLADRQIDLLMNGMLK